MTCKRVYIAGTGIISPLGRGTPATLESLRNNTSALRPLSLFTLLQPPTLPVGEVQEAMPDSSLPRTHNLALYAAKQAMRGCDNAPDAVVLGTTTGGILTSEELLRREEKNKEPYRYHGLDSVTQEIAKEYGCSGPALTLSTACSSGALAIALAMRMLQSGRVNTVLAGGVDSLCRLTYFGFHSLQLVDAKGCKPLDKNRHGMAVAEGAGMLLLTSWKPPDPIAELLGAGVSCDAYHPAAPHPEGRGAFTAMHSALNDAGLIPEDIDYISLHGTGTIENDLAESKAVRRLFTNPPPLSSIKGASGHSLAAAGAIEAVVATITIDSSFLPANCGLQTPDPELNLSPLTKPVTKPGEQTVRAVLSNSFGFGGNNCSLVIAEPEHFSKPEHSPGDTTLAVHGSACLTGAGTTKQTLTLLAEGRCVTGTADINKISKDLSPSLVRRLKRLPRMALALASEAQAHSKQEIKPQAVFMGTGWGALSETNDFLERLSATEERFPSPTDFVGSVHNGPAGQAAIMLGAEGANVTCSGGDYSFEQALLAAELLLEKDGSALVIGADEYHPRLSAFFDPSIEAGSPPADGGGALLVNRNLKNADCLVRMPFYQTRPSEDALTLLLDSLGGPDTMHEYGLALVGIPKAATKKGEQQLARFLSLSGLDAPLVRYRQLTGEFASASATAASLAVLFLLNGQAPSAFTGSEHVIFQNETNKILVLGLGESITAMQFFRP